MLVVGLYLCSSPAVICAPVLERVQPLNVWILLAITAEPPQAPYAGIEARVLHRLLAVL